MFKSYIKIAWKVLLRRKFFTFISLFGISFTLMILMVATSLFDHVFGPQMPEHDTDRLLFVNQIRVQVKEGYTNSGPASYSFFDRHVRSLKTPEKVSINSIFFQVNSYINNRKLALDIKYTDREFWDILNFNFLEGNAFTQQDVKSANRVAVINENTRAQYFGDAEAIGKEIVVDQVKYKVIGVVENVPVLRVQSYADIWVPITLKSQDFSKPGLRGTYFATIKARQSSDIPEIKAEYAAMMQEVERQHPEKDAKLFSFPDTFLESFARTFLGNGNDAGVGILYSILTVLALLFMLLPTINLVSINISRIMERSSEIGVRKAFGASSSTIIGQFIIENIFLTLLGGLLGFILSAGVLWLINDSGMIVYANLGLNLRVFAMGMLLCLVFGLISGVYPAYKMSRLQAVEALKGGSK
ncbi:ABC transporter permease [Pontibacter sp. BT310]|uniref:ABC transporter permease n=1 Tax=Pontibacter populi TaxID=890055 RepID=A0ABS6XCP1_9BACT|nr:MULTISPECIES: ABC transporter permease [Pontibacter]MBJ6118916.1 ABC transporter permease [Pontibacter sp. BT310]MBR0571344.1 ABC transporter permease [Microvirga sp. STS03]MBW3365770.1 ABC transporter permease [Pontibacter populi]